MSNFVSWYIVVRERKKDVLFIFVLECFWILLINELMQESIFTFLISLTLSDILIFLFSALFFKKNLIWSIDFWTICGRIQHLIW